MSELYYCGRLTNCQFDFYSQACGLLEPPFSYSMKLRQSLKSLYHPFGCKQEMVRVHLQVSEVAAANMYIDWVHGDLSPQTRETNEPLSTSSGSC